MHYARLRVLLLAVLLTLGLTACSSKPRTDPPAPVFERGTQISGDSGTLRPGQTAGVDTPSLYAEETVFEPQVMPLAPATSPTQAPAAERLALTESPTQTPTASSAPSVPSEAPARATSTRSMTPATQTLLSKADVEQADGNLTAAASTLERALRIENHPLLWNRLAGVRLQQQQYSLAADLAEKSNALAANDNSLRRNNWELIARARQAAGDSAAAQDAVQRANALR